MVRRWLMRIAAALVLFALLDAAYLWFKIPDWAQYASGPVKKSSFIEGYEKERAEHADWPALRWSPVSIASIPKHVIHAVIAAEDARFYQHEGFDKEAFEDAMEQNLAKRRLVYGASTISQQTAKNLFLNPSRNPLRKWHEVVLTYFMEKHLQKRRIIEIYLNVAEFGRGVYGVDAAARYYWGKSISAVTPDEALELAATLPGPVNHNPKTRTRFFLHHKRTIARHVAASERGTAPTMPDAVLSTPPTDAILSPPPADIDNEAP